jgi:import inner membrane translocase subunit TIM22
MGSLHCDGDGIMCGEDSPRWGCRYVPISSSSPSCPSCGAFSFAGFGIGAFFSLMSASFAYEDPYLRQQTQAGLNAGQKAREVFKDMGRGMWRSGKGFGKVGALFAGIECVIESVSTLFNNNNININAGFSDVGYSTELKTISSTL